MTTPDDLRAELTRLAQDAVGLEGDLPEGDLAEHFDSVERLGFVVAIEDHFEIMFDADDEQEVRTVDDVLAVVRKKLESKGG